MDANPLKNWKIYYQLDCRLPTIPSRTNTDHGNDPFTGRMRSLEEVDYCSNCLIRVIQRHWYTRFFPPFSALTHISKGVVLSSHGELNSKENQRTRSGTHTIICSEHKFVLMRNIRSTIYCLYALRYRASSIDITIIIVFNSCSR